jgi:hypothetical protein
MRGHNQKKDTHTLDFDVTLPYSAPAGFESFSTESVTY